MQGIQFGGEEEKKENSRDDGVSLVGESAGLEMRVN